MDELFGTDNLSKSKKKILDKEKEEAFIAPSPHF